MLTLLRKEEVANGVYEFVFQPDRAFSFKPGQYLEWTLGHKSPDNRGNRRYFTIASSPTEKEINLGVKLYDSPSSFKRTLLEMRTSDIISASQLAGDFVLPKNKNNKLVFMAGGIGVTPFRSMLQYMLDTKDKRPVTMLYSNKTVAEIAYKDVFDMAQKELGIKTIYAITDETIQAPGVYNGLINSQLIVQEIPDYKERTFYISGPHGMVEAFKKILTEMGVPRWKIKADYFPGFV
jgi:ferredoxin-NADP reductase